MAISKTNVMRLLDVNEINYNILTYDTKDGKIDGVSVAEKIGRKPELVYKTLVTRGSNREIYVFIIPVEKELDLKKAALTAGEKKVELVPVKDIRRLTGYIRGGCSPVGMKKDYPIFLDESVSELDQIIVSGGKIGLQVELKVEDLSQITEAVIADIAAQ